MNKIVLLIVLLAMGAIILATAPGYNFVVDGEERAFRGYYKVEKGLPYVFDEIDNQKYRLLLAPKEAMDSLGIVLIENDSLYVEGVPTPSGVLVTSLITGINSENIWALRSHDLTYNYYDDPSTVRVNPKSCIGCQLCIQPCPVGAISMAKGKAVIDPAACVECGICIDGNGKFKGCPVRAISK